MKIAQIKEVPDNNIGLYPDLKDWDNEGDLDLIIPPAPPNHDRGADIISVHKDLDSDGVYETSKNILIGLNMANSVV